MYLIFDTETTGLPLDYNAPVEKLDNWPRVVQIAWQLHDINGKLIEVKNFIIKPVGFSIPYNAEKIHGISTERALKQGVDIELVFREFNNALSQTKFLAGHNIEFDIKVWAAEYLRSQINTDLLHKKILDTKNESTEFCAIPGGKSGKYKWPTLTELHQKLFQTNFNEAHNASADVEATARCFFELIRLSVISKQKLEISDEEYREFLNHNPDVVQPIGLNVQPYNPNELIDQNTHTIHTLHDDNLHNKKEEKNLDNLVYCHLHNHTQYTVLQSTTEITKLVKKANQYKMPALALTDNGNMMAAFEFVKEINNHNRIAEEKNKLALQNNESPSETIIKPILGCELNICRNRLDKNNKDNGYPIVCMAKNENGYKNLSRLSSIAYTEGFYYVPRIDKETLLQYKTDIIVTTGGLYGEVPWLILNVGQEKAEEAFVWWKKHFGDDFYAELLRHNLEEEEIVNDILIKFCKKYNVKYFAANNTYYLNKEDAKAHDILLCVKEGEKQTTPIGKGRGYRYGFPNDEFYFKSQEEMKKLFADIPEAIETISEIINKISVYKLERTVLLPKFNIPEEFIHPEDLTDGGKRGENAYLKHLAFEGAKQRYGTLTPEIEERLNFELQTIANTGYPGYFLIVQDFTRAAREMGVSVGPGRGSAAGSLVAYCIGITNIDPVKYDLLFERFLNPERISLPDIDIDFDDEGRDKVIQYVINKYGAGQVAQIITYGTMAAKSSIRDTARVLDLPLSDADKIAKLIPTNYSLAKILESDEASLKAELSSEDFEMVKQLRQIANGNDLAAQTVKQARLLEGSLRNTGIHACGVIITPDDIRNFVPIATAKDSDLFVTQFDNSVVESAGLLKMDFLGLKNLTIIKDAVHLIKQRHGIELNPDNFPLDDEKTYQLFQQGATNGLFQFESPGMQKYLRELKPDKFDDLIAMNALYRPGPLEYIPNFIRRKHGQEPITYDLPEMEEYLKETYGITVYQEQVMLLSQKLANFTKGQADTLRKAMGKKDRKTLDKLKPLFIENASQNGHDKDKLEKIWKDWEAFASYAFNKSHSTCYAYLAFQTGYLKAHYPAEYMAALLTHNMSDIKNVTFYMEECKRMRLPVLGPDVNESEYKFTVNKNGAIRFGMGAIKGVGENAVENIIHERKNNGLFKGIFDFTKRIDLRAANKRTLENLAYAGAFDCFNIPRATYFLDEGNGNTFLNKAIKYGNSLQNDANSSQQSLFGEETTVQMPEPAIPTVEEWHTLDKLNKEKEVVGVFISGHPLDDYKLELEHLCRGTLSDIANLSKENIGKEYKVAGIVTDKEHRIAKNGNQWGYIILQDYESSCKINLFGEDYQRFRHLMTERNFLFITGRVNNRKFADKEEIEFKVTQIDLLSEIKNKYVKSIQLKMSINSLNENLIDLLDNTLKKNKGNCKLTITIEDAAEKIKIDMPSLAGGISLNEETISLLEELKNKEIHYSLK